MIQFEDEGIIVGRKRYGERSCIYYVFTSQHGYHAGILRASSKNFLIEGTIVKAQWKARLGEQLGNWTLHVLKAPPILSLTSFQLKALSLLCYYGSAFLPERHPYPSLYASFHNLIASLEMSEMPISLARFEVQLLKELGFGLKLEKCAVTFSTQDLAYVSPKTGCAVTQVVGDAYKDRLLELPSFLGEGGLPSLQELRSAFQLTGFFLEKHFKEPRFKSIFKERHDWLQIIWEQNLKNI